MALPIESRVYGPLTVPKPPAVRSQARAVPESDGETVQRAAQAFVQTLTGDVRERQSQINRDPSKKNNFSDAKRAEEDQPRTSALAEEAVARAPASEEQDSSFFPITGLPVLRRLPIWFRLNCCTSKVITIRRCRCPMRDTKARIRLIYRLARNLEAKPRR